MASSGHRPRRLRRPGHVPCDRAPLAGTPRLARGAHDPRWPRRPRRGHRARVLRTRPSARRSWTRAPSHAARRAAPGPRTARWPGRRPTWRAVHRVPAMTIACAILSSCEWHRRAASVLPSVGARPAQAAQLLMYVPARPFRAPLLPVLHGYTGRHASSHGLRAHV